MSGSGAAVVRVVESSVPEHGAGDGEKPVPDGPQRPSVRVAASPEAAVAGLAARVVLGRDASRVIEGVAELVLHSEAPDLSAVLPDWMLTGATPERARSAW